MPGLNTLLAFLIGVLAFHHAQLVEHFGAKAWHLLQMVQAALHLLLEIRIGSQELFDLRWRLHRLLIGIVGVVYPVDSLSRVRKIGGVFGDSLVRLIPALVSLRDALVLRVVALPRAEHAAICLGHVHQFLGVLERRQAPVLPYALLLVPRSLRGQMVARVVRRRDNLRLHVEKGNHSVKVKIVRRALVYLLAAAIDEALERQHLRAVHIDSLANTHESFLVRWQDQLEILHGLVHLLRQSFFLSLFPLHALSGSNLVSLLKHYKYVNNHKYMRDKKKMRIMKI